jgi:hypothetical protein
MVPPIGGAPGGAGPGSVADPAVRSIDHVVHVVADLEAAASAYHDLGFAVTPRADHPFGTSNRLVVLSDSYLEIVAVTAPGRIPAAGFAARVADHLRSRGPGISHVVFTSHDPASDLASLGELATGEVFSFSRPAPQLEGPAITAAFECVLVDSPVDLGMFLCHHRTREAVWNRASTSHRNRVTALTALRLPIETESLRMLGRVAGAGTESGRLELGRTSVSIGPAFIGVDGSMDTALIAGVRVGRSVEGMQ